MIKVLPPYGKEGVHHVKLKAFNVSLTLFFDDVITAYQQLVYDHLLDNSSYGEAKPNVDAWFLDGFAPAKNPEMWQSKLFDLMAKLSHNQTTFSTFTAASLVRNGLTKAGFNCQKIQGFGKKREQLIGQYQGKPSERESDTPTKLFSKYDEPANWMAMPGRNLPSKSIAVIGAGLAGCHTAYALAQRGFNVTVYERESIPATRASGNQQGVVYTKLSPHDNPLCQLNLTTQIHSNHFYHSHNLFRECGEQCGVFHIATKEKEREHYRELAKLYNPNSHFIQWVNKENSTKITGHPLKFDGLYLPESGWLNPPQLCKKLLDHKNISVQYSKQIDKLINAEEKADNQWLLVGENNQTLGKADIVVIANAHEALKFAQSSHLPLKRIRGQVSHILETSQSSRLQTAVCGDGYIAPAQNGIHCIGATFDLTNQSNELDDQSHVENLNNLAKMLPELNSVHLDKNTAGRVGFRCTTPDYFPIVGPIPIKADIEDSFTSLRYNANYAILEHGSFYRGLYCNLGYGSKGLAYGPLMANTLANIIAGEYLPISRSLFQHLHPARFIIKDIIRRKNG